MKSASPLSGALHVVWSLPAGGCDKVLLSRKPDGGAYALAYTLTGTATSQHDTQVKAGGKYCYTAACKTAGGTSEESNEICGSP